MEKHQKIKANKPEARKLSKSPLDIKRVAVKGIGMNDVLRAIKEGRKEY